MLSKVVDYLKRMEYEINHQAHEEAVNLATLKAQGVGVW